MSRVERHAAEEAGLRRNKESAEALSGNAADKGDSAGDRGPGSGKAKKSKTPMTPFGRFLSFFGSFVMWLVILLCVVLMAPRIAGIQSYVVISGSMEPAIPVGSLVYAKGCEPSEVAPGEVIVFYSSTGKNGQSPADKSGTVPVTHRVIENNTQTGELITKGDANKNEDLSPVTYNNVLGRVIFHVKGLGYLASVFATMTGKIGAAMIILAGYILTEVADRLRIQT